MNKVRDKIRKEGENERISLNGPSNAPNASFLNTVIQPEGMLESVNSRKYGATIISIILVEAKHEKCRNLERGEKLVTPRLIRPIYSERPKNALISGQFSDKWNFYLFQKK